jgi:hypothetical protein
LGALPLRLLSSIGRLLLSEHALDEAQARSCTHYIPGNHQPPKPNDEFSSKSPCLAVHHIPKIIASSPA